MDLIKLSYIVERTAAEEQEARLVQLQRGELSDPEVATLRQGSGIDRRLYELFRPLDAQETAQILSLAGLGSELTAVPGSVQDAVESGTGARTAEATMRAGVEVRTDDDGGARSGNVIPTT